jgi:iron complex outermembrane receptor protein
MRGFPAASFSVDGLRVGSGYGPIPVEALDRIEILTGLTGFLYGGTDVGGMIDYVLKKPTPVPYHSLTLGDYGNTSWYSDLDAGGPLDNGKFGYRINIVGQDGTLPTDPQQFQRGLVTGAFDYNIAPGTTFEVLGLHHDTVLKGEGSSWIISDLPSGASAFNYKTVPNPSEYWNQPFTTQHEVDDRAEANIHSEINDIFTLRAAYAFERSWVGSRYTSYNDVLDNNGDFTQHVSISSPYAVNVNTAYGFLDAKFATGPIEHKLTMGAYGDQEAVSMDAGSTTSVASEYNWNIPPVYTGPPSVVPSASSASYYGTPYTASHQYQLNYVIGDDVKFNNHWSALIGENYATIDTTSFNGTPPFALNSSIDESKLTPTASLIFKPVPWISTYGTYSESLFQGAMVPISTAYTNSGAILPPYIAKEYEFGTKANVGGVLLTAAWFNLNKANQYAQSNPDGTLTEVQDGRQVHQGIELTAIGNITTGLRIFGGITWMDAKVEQAANPVDDNKEPLATADQMAKVTLEYDLPFLRGVTLTGGAYYTGRSPADTINAVWVPAYVTEDAGVRYTTTLPTGQEAIFRLNVINLTNKAYWVSSSRVGDPRTIAFSGQFKF